MTQLFEPTLTSRDAQALPFGRQILPPDRAGGALSGARFGKLLDDLVADRKPLEQREAEPAPNDKADEPQSKTPLAEVDEPGDPQAEPGSAEEIDAKPVESKPIDTGPVDSKPVESTPVGPEPLDAKPTDAKPTDAKPTDAKPTDAKPTDAKPTDAMPTDAKPTDAKPTEAKPVDAKPIAADPKPVEQTPTQQTPEGSNDKGGLPKAPINPSKPAPAVKVDAEPVRTDQDVPEARPTAGRDSLGGGRAAHAGISRATSAEIRYAARVDLAALASAELSSGPSPRSRLTDAAQSTSRGDGLPTRLRVPPVAAEPHGKAPQAQQTNGLPASPPSAAARDSSRQADTVIQHAAIAPAPIEAHARTGVPFNANGHKAPLTNSGGGRGDLARSVAGVAGAVLAKLGGSVSRGATVFTGTADVRSTSASVAKFATPARPASAQVPPSLAQVQRALASIVRQQGGSMTLRLSPVTLGEVRVNVEMREGVLTARFIPSTDQARQLLKDNLEGLRSSLQTKGLTVEQLTVERVGFRDPHAMEQRGGPEDPGPKHTGEGSPKHQPGALGRDSDTEGHGGSGPRQDGQRGAQQGANGADGSGGKDPTNLDQAADTDTAGWIDQAGQIRLDTIA